MLSRLLPEWVPNVAVVVAALSLLGILVRQIVPSRSQLTAEEAQFRADLRAENAKLRTRLDKMEHDLSDERAKCDERMEKIEAAASSERERCEAELRIVKHRLTGGRQIIYSLLHLFDLPAARRKAMLERVRQDIAAIEQAEAAEVGAMLGARSDGVAK